MRAGLLSAIALVLATPGTQARQPEYAALWANATPFHVFLEDVKAHRDQWTTRFADAAIEPAALTAARALPGRRRILAVATDRCSDSAWVLPYIAKLAAAVPEKLELRVVEPREGSRIQAAHPTPDGRLATPTVAVLDEGGRFIGAWIERPAELQNWYIQNKSTLGIEELYDRASQWYADDAGRSTIRELLAILSRDAAEGK